MKLKQQKAYNFTLKSEKSVWERSKDGFISTVNSIVKSFGNFVVNIVAASPVIVPAAVVFIILLLKIKKYWKKKV